MTKKQCPLGDDCDLTVAWMLGRQNAKDEIAALKEQLEAARRDVKEAEAYAGELEAKLAKAVDMLCVYTDPLAMNDEDNAALAELLKEEKT